MVGKWADRKVSKFKNRAAHLSTYPTADSDIEWICEGTISTFKMLGSIYSRLFIHSSGLFQRSGSKNFGACTAFSAASK